MFIADIDTGNIIYSVYKELDYATSLLNGPYANTGIGEAFKKAASANNPEYVYLTDFNTYSPSYNAPAAFMSSPIYDGTKKIGVLIIQMPINKINSIMTHHEKWEQSGLGYSGETLLTAKDGYIRSNNRAIIENIDGFINILKTDKLASTEDINRIKQLESTVGIVRI